MRPLRSVEREFKCVHVPGHGVFRDILTLKTQHMTYELNGNSLLFALDRTQIVDISAGDLITVKGCPGVEYEWTNHDLEFLENNPDDDIYLQVERTGKDQFKATGILLKEVSKM